MMKQKICYCLSLSLLFVMAFRPFADKISWSENRKLSWNDFKGSPSPTSRFDALTQWNIHYSFEYNFVGEEMKVKYEVSCFFDTQKSWRRKDKESAYLLQHEQLHFDIAELHARKLRKRYSEYKFQERTITADFKKIFREEFTACETMQKSYDSESKHSMDKNGQNTWNTFIKNELPKLAAFKSR